MYLLSFRKLFKHKSFTKAMEITIENVHQDLIKLQRQIELLNRILLNEGKLTPWAMKELERARLEKEESYTNLDEL